MKQTKDCKTEIKVEHQRQRIENPVTKNTENTKLYFADLLFIWHRDNCNECIQSPNNIAITVCLPNQSNQVAHNCIVKLYASFNIKTNTVQNRFC